MANIPPEVLAQVLASGAAQSNFPGPYDYANYGLSPHLIRSESTENEKARRQLPGNLPVSIMGDLIGRFDPAVGENNEYREAVRRHLLQKMLETGAPAMDNYGSRQNYGQ